MIEAGYVGVDMCVDELPSSRNRVERRVEKGADGVDLEVKKVEEDISLAARQPCSLNNSNNNSQ